MASGGEPAPTALLVHGIPPGVEGDDLKVFFNRQKNGGCGDVEEVTFPLHYRHPTSARIVFADAATVLRICSAERVMKGSRLRLEPAKIEDSASQKTLIKPVNSCPKHPKQPLDYVCNEHGCVGKLFCIHCVHSEHKDHAWTLLEYELREKRAEVDKVVLPDLRGGVDALKAGVDTIKAKLMEAEKRFQGELKTVKDDEKINLDKLEAEFDDNQKKLEDDYNKQKLKITEEAKRVSTTVATKWGAKKKELGDSEKKCFQYLRDMRSELASVERSRSETDVKALSMTISQARKYCEGSEGLKLLPLASATLPATVFNLAQFAALGLAVTQKPKPGTERQELASEVFQEVTCVVSPANVAEVLTAAAKMGRDVTARMTAGRTTLSAAMQTLEKLHRDLGKHTSSTDQRTAQVSSKHVAPALLVHDIPLRVDAVDVENFFGHKKNGGYGDVEEVTFPLDARHPSSARITFDEETGAETIQRVMAKKRMMNGCFLRLEMDIQHDDERVLYVHNIPAGCKRRGITAFFSRNKNGGNGDVVRSKFPLDDRHTSSAKIYFLNKDTITSVCSAERVMGGNVLQLDRSPPTPDSPIFLEVSCVVNKDYTGKVSKELKNDDFRGITTLTSSGKTKLTGDWGILSKLKRYVDDDFEVVSHNQCTRTHEKSRPWPHSKTPATGRRVQRPETLVELYSNRM